MRTPPSFHFKALPGGAYIICVICLPLHGPFVRRMGRKGRHARAKYQPLADSEGGHAKSKHEVPTRADFEGRHAKTKDDVRSEKLRQFLLHHFHIPPFARTDSRVFKGDKVFIRDFGPATAESEGAIADVRSKYLGRIRVQYPDGSTYHVAPEQVESVHRQVDLRMDVNGWVSLESLRKLPSTAHGHIRSGHGDVDILQCCLGLEQLEVDSGCRIVRIREEKLRSRVLCAYYDCVLDEDGRGWQYHKYEAMVLKQGADWSLVRDAKDRMDQHIQESILRSFHLGAKACRSVAEGQKVVVGGAEATVQPHEGQQGDHSQVVRVRYLDGSVGTVTPEQIESAEVQLQMDPVTGFVPIDSLLGIPGLPKRGLSLQQVVECCSAAEPLEMDGARSRVRIRDTARRVTTMKQSVPSPFQVYGLYASVTQHRAGCSKEAEEAVAQCVALIPSNDWQRTPGAEEGHRFGFDDVTTAQSRFLAAQRRLQEQVRGEDAPTSSSLALRDQLRAAYIDVLRNAIYRNGSVEERMADCLSTEQRIVSALKGLTRAGLGAQCPKAPKADSVRHACRLAQAAVRQWYRDNDSGPITAATDKAIELAREALRCTPWFEVPCSQDLRGVQDRLDNAQRALTMELSFWREQDPEGTVPVRHLQQACNLLLDENRRAHDAFRRLAWEQQRFTAELRHQVEACSIDIRDRVVADFDAAQSHLLDMQDAYVDAKLRVDRAQARKRDTADLCDARQRALLLYREAQTEAQGVALRLLHASQDFPELSEHLQTWVPVDLQNYWLHGHSLDAYDAVEAFPQTSRNRVFVATKGEEAVVLKQFETDALTVCLQEAAFLHRLQHPNIVRMNALFVDLYRLPCLYVEMPFYEGGTLDSWVTHRRPDDVSVRTTLSQVLFDVGDLSARTGCTGC